MMKNKLTALVLSMSMTIASAASFSANASDNLDSLYYWGAVSNCDVFKDCLKIEKEYNQMWVFSSPEEFQVYARLDEYHRLETYEIERASDYVTFTIPANCDQNVIDKISDISENDSLYLDQRIYEDDELYGEFIVKSCDENGDIIKTMDQETANEIYDLVGEYAAEFEYEYGYFYYHKSFSNYPSLTYLTHCSEDSEREAMENDMTSCIREFDLNVKFVSDCDDEHDKADHVDIVPNEDSTVDEVIEIVQKIYDKTGRSPAMIRLESPGSSLNIGGTVDMKNAVKGDANDDSEITIADATTILQALGNPDKYALSAQGKYNADVDGKAGITASDAIAIQQYDVKLVEKLPIA